MELSCFYGKHNWSSTIADHHILARQGTPEATVLLTLLTHNRQSLVTWKAPVCYIGTCIDGDINVYMYKTSLVYINSRRQLTTISTSFTKYNIFTYLQNIYIFRKYYLQNNVIIWLIIYFWWWNCRPQEGCHLIGAYLLQTEFI